MNNFKKLIKEALTPHYLRESVNEDLSQKLNNELGSIDGTFAEEDIKASDADFYDVKPGKYIKFYIEDVNNSTILKVKRIAKANGLKFAKDLEDMLLFTESVNEDFTHSSLAITDQSQISGLDDSELLDLLNKVSYEYTPELKDSARIISQEIEDRDLTNKIHYVDNERYEFRESINEADKYVDARGNFKLRNGLEVKIKPASEIKKFNIGKDYMKYNLQIAGKTVKIEKAFRGEFGGAPSQFKVKGYDYFKTWSSGKPRDGFDQIIIDDVVRESINENVDEGQYRIYMNSDADDPKRINYEEYFESGTKDEMVRMAKKWIAEPDAKNMYGDPLLVSVTHEDYIDIVAWANEPVNEDIQPLAVEELTDEALLNMLKNIDDMNRDKKGGTYDMSGRKMTRAQYDLARSVDAEVSRRNLDLSYERTSGLDIDDSYEIGESVNEGFEWYQPLLALGGSVGLMATALFAVLGPSALIGGSFMGGDSWGDVFRHYKKKFSDKKAAKNLKKEDVQELINLIQTNIDTSDLKSGVKRYMKSLMNELENEMNKDEEEVDKNKLLVLLRNVENYAKRNQVNVNEAKTESELKDAWREWNKKHPKDQIDWGEYREEHGEHLDEVTQKEIDDIENSGNIDIAYKKALKLLNSLKGESVNETGLGIPKPRYLNDMSYEELLGLRRRSDFPKYSKALKKDIKDLIDKKKPVNEDSAGRMELLKTGGYKDVKGKKHILKKGQMGKHERVGWDGDFIHFGSLIFSADVFDRDDLEVYESVNESVYGSVGFIPSDKDAKPEHPNWSDLSAEEIQDYIDANPDTLWGRSLSIAKMVLRDKKSGINEDIVDDKAKIYWLQKFTKGEIDTLPDNPRMEYLRHAMRDQLAQDKEQLSRERGEMSDEEEHEHVKNLLKRNFMDEELTSLTPNEIGDESKQNTSASGAYESKEFNFKSMIKEALKYKPLR